MMKDRILVWAAFVLFPSRTASFASIGRQRRHVEVLFRSQQQQRMITLCSTQQQENDRLVGIHNKKNNNSNTTAADYDDMSQNNTTNTSIDPSYAALMRFTAITALIWLSESLLSIVDTTVVGLTQKADAVTQLAALGPATTLIDSLIYATYFLSIATTNTIAGALARQDTEQLRTTTAHVVTVAILLGLSCTALCWTCGVPLVRRMVGTAAVADPHLVYCASRYVWIRASTAVCAVTGVVLQSICLASLDTKTPVVAVAVASVVNIVGDILLRQWGLLGAATATAAASVCSAAILWRAVVRNQWKAWNAGVVGTARKSLWQIPDRKAMLQLVTVSGPIFFVMLSKIFCYGAMTLRCTEFGVVPLAAQSIMMRIFFFFACFGDSFSQTAQSYLPATLVRQRESTKTKSPSSSSKNKSFSRVFHKLLVLAGLAGLANSQISSFVLRKCGKFFLSSSSGGQDNSLITNIMHNHAGYMSLSILLHPFIMLLEGTVLASQDFSTLWWTYATTTVLHFGILHLLCGSFTGVWRTFVLFQATRLSLYSWRVWRRRQKQQEATHLAATSAL